MNINNGSSWLSFRPLAHLAALSLALAMISTPAAAQVSEERGFSIERFALSLDRLGVLGVDWGEVLPHLSWDAGLWLGYVDDPLVVYDTASGDRLGSLVATRVGGSLHGAIGYRERYQLGLELPFVVHQGRESMIPGVTTAPLPPLGDVGVGDLRLVPKVHLATIGGVALSGLAAFGVPSGGGDNYRGQDGITADLGLAASRRIGALRLASNVGYRMRKDVQFLNQRVADELLLRLGVGYRFEDRPGGGRPLELAATVSGATAAASPFANANQNALELLLGVNYRVSASVLVVTGGGLGLNEGFGTPDWRFFSGVRFSQVPRVKAHTAEPLAQELCFDGSEVGDGCSQPALPGDKDGDGVLDADDGAPLDPEDKDGFEDNDGVPDPDNDGDGVLDVDDKCSEVAGLAALGGCPDGDGDGIADGDDRCPAEPEDADGYQDEDGCPEPDNDGDLVLDGSDRCPVEAGPPENGGCPDTDRDGDTVVDRLDNCPDEVGTPENAGCKARQLVQITGQKLEILDSVYFKQNKDVIMARSFALLDNVAQVITAHSELESIRVEGHTDSVGNDAKNLTLSQRRANAVVAYLVKRGVAAARLEAVGYGETLPVADNKTKDGRAQNRRVEFKLVGAANGQIQDSKSGPAADTMEP